MYGQRIQVHTYGLAMKMLLVDSILIVMLIMTAGCQESRLPAVPAKTLPRVPYVDAHDLQQKLTDDSLVFVEFCVPVGCARCDEMREQVDRLASENAAEAIFCRVNLHSGRDFAAQHGVRVCPSYALFHRGQMQLLAAYPTTGDLLAGALYRSLQDGERLTAN